MRILIAVVVFCAGILVGVPSFAQIELSQDFDSGSLNVAESVVDGSQVSLVGRQSWENVSAYRWVYFRATNVQGTTPQFSIDASSFLGSLGAGHRFVYSYDQQNWEFFENAEINADDIYEFSSNAPFVENVVYVAYGLPYPVSRAEDYVDSISSSPYVAPTESADSNFVVAQSAAGVDETGRVVPVQNVLGFCLTDFSETSPKRVAVLAGGSHSSENAGNFGLEGMLDFLLSDDPRAALLRVEYKFYVYPMTNPAGRFGGYYRSNPENPDKDFNRFYNNPDGFTELSDLTLAMKADTGSEVDLLIDFHSWFGSWSSENFVFTLPELASDPFFGHLQNLQPGFGIINSNGQPGMLRIWGMSETGLNAKLAMTPEIGFHPFRYESDLKAIGVSFAGALYERVLPESVVASSFAVEAGNLVSGGLGDLSSSNNIDVTARRASSDIQSRVNFVFETNSPIANPFEITFEIESSVFARTAVVQEIDMFDFEQGAWEQVYSGSASRFLDATVTVSCSNDVSRFIDPVRQMMRTRCRFQSGANRQQFSVGVDQVEWFIER